jgi:hypothetical protein
VCKNHATELLALPIPRRKCPMCSGSVTASQTIQGIST